MVPIDNATKNTLFVCGADEAAGEADTDARYLRDQHRAPGVRKGVRSELVGPKDGLGAIGDRHERQVSAEAPIASVAREIGTSPAHPALEPTAST